MVDTHLICGAPSFILGRDPFLMEHLGFLLSEHKKRKAL